MSILGDFVTLTRGTTYQSSLLNNGGPVLLGLASIEPNGGFRRASLKTYGGECPERITLKPGDIYVSLKDVTQSGDLLGAAARVPADVPLGRLTQDTVKLVLKPGAPTDYLYWLLRTPQYRDYCRAHATGTTNLGLPREDFLSFPVPTPSTEQHRLVETLRALDDKIELNRRMNETLEALAQLRFDSVPRSSFVPLDDLVRLARNAVDPAAEPVEQFEHFSIPAFDDGQVPVVESGSAIKSSKLSVPDRAVLLSKLNPRISRVWLPDIAAAQRPICSTEFLVALPTARSSREFLYCLFRSRAFIEEFAGRVAGTSGSHQRVKAADVLAIQVAVPTPTDLAELSVALQPLLERVAANRRESRTLAELRDALLPKLISGELRVRDAEAAVEAAAT